MDRKARSVVRLLGELVVIVVGVLIALWVDNLNANRQAHLQESAYLAGILDDLGSDTESLRQRETTAIRGLEVADRLLALWEAPTLSAPADSLATWFFRAAFVDNFEVLDHTYREILGAGGLTLIRDEALRRAISSYYRSIESAEFFTEWYKGEESDYWDLLAERLHPADFGAMTRSEEQSGSLDSDRVLRQLRNDAEIANAVLMNRHWTQLRLEITNRRLEANRRLQETLRDALLARGAL